MKNGDSIQEPVHYLNLITFTAKILLKNAVPNSKEDLNYIMRTSALSLKNNRDFTKSNLGNKVTLSVASQENQNFSEL